MSRTTTELSALGPFLTVQELAKAMRVSKMTIYRLVHSGQLPAVRVGRSLRVPQSSWDTYLREHPGCTLQGA